MAVIAAIYPTFSELTQIGSYHHSAAESFYPTLLP